MKPRKTLSIYVLLIGVMGLSIVGGILAFQIFSAATKTQLTTEQIETIKPIDGSIDQAVITNLDKRIPIPESDLNNLQMTPQSTPTINPTPSPIAATESATTNTP